MWDGPGPRQGPRGGPPYRGDHRGEMFGGRDRPMPDYRGRDDMNMGHMGPRPHDLPSMDARRMDGPPMRGRDMDPREMRGREPNRDFFRHGEEPDFTLRRQYEISIREKLMNASGFPGPGRNLPDMGGRGMPPWDPNNKFNDTRDRESFNPNMPRFNNPNADGRRGFPMDQNDGCRDMRDWQPMGTGDGDRYNRDLPPHENRRMDSDRRGGPPFNPRGEFDSDMDFRNRPGPSADFRGRDRSPLRFGSNDVPPVDRARPDMPPDFSGPQRPDFMGAEDSLRQSEYPESSDSPLTDYRSGEEMTLAEEWKNRQKDKRPFVGKSIGGVSEPNFPVGFGRDMKIRDAPPFQERNRPPVEFPRKDIGFTRDERFPLIDRPPIGIKGPQENPPPPEISKFTGPPGRDTESEHWLGERPPKHIQNKSHGEERPHYHQEKNLPKPENQEPKDCFKGMEDGPRVKMELEHNFQSSNIMQVRDQDYRDIDYRTGSGRTFEYKHEELQGPEEKLITETKPIAPSKFSESGSQDQDYRSASVEEKVSNTISIIGIPKTATMEQILGAFAVRDGVPMQGMKIKNVVPGYSYDTAYVEFLNLEDAVHFMESNKGSLKVGTKTATMKFIQPDKRERAHESDHKVPLLQEPQLLGPDEPPKDFNSNLNGTEPAGPAEPAVTHGAWQRSSDLTPEAWQQQVDQQLQQQEREQLADSWGSRIHPPHGSQRPESVFKDSKTMIIKNVKNNTSVETILKALDPFAYLDERNVRLVKGKPPGTKCFCFVDMDSHEQVTRLVELLTKPRPLYIDGVRVYAEVAKPLKNQNFRRDSDKPNSSILGYPPEPNMMGQPPFSQPPQFLQPPAAPPPVGMTGDLLPAMNLPLDPSISQGVGFCETQNLDPSFHAGGPHVPTESAAMSSGVDGQAYMSGSENPDMANYLFDATSGFYYDPETTFYYDPNSRYFYNAQTQEYMYWDAATKTYVPVPGGNSAAETQPAAMTAEDQAILSNPAADAPLEMKKPSVTPSTPGDLVDADAAATAALDPAAGAAVASLERKDDDESGRRDKEDKPKSLQAVKIMKDMERWAKIQNRHKDVVRSPSPLLRTGMDDDRRQSKSADAGFAIFERKISGGDDLFKKPLAPLKMKDEKSKRSMGSLGMLASDYAAGSDDEIEEDKEEAAKGSQGGHSDDKEDKLTDWRKMACLLCRRQFPNKDALVRHQQLSDLHKQNMEIHLKIKRSKKELEALENQEREMSAKTVESTRSPEPRKRKQQQQQQQQQQHNTWAGGSREMSKVSERPGLGAEPVQQRKKKEHVVWDHATYKQAVRKAMFARFKELD